MKDRILTHVNDPAQLEELYRADKAAFKRAFKLVYPELGNHLLAAYWHERLKDTDNGISPGTGRELVAVAIAILLAGLIVKLPALFSIDPAFFYTRNAGFVIFPLLTAYFCWKNRLPARNVIFIACAILVGAVFINTLPNVAESDTLILSCIHLPIFLWSILAYTFGTNSGDAGKKQFGFLTYNGDLIVMTTLILLAGGILSGITIGLFSLIGFEIETFYFENVGIFGLAAAPIVGTYLTQTNPQLVGKVSPAIARIFGPLVLLMLIVYLTVVLYTGKNPYTDREFLLVFNILLIGVMAIIFFSIAGAATLTENRIASWILLLLSIVTILVNCIALSAILFRISEWGITPNRTAVLGSNILMLSNLAVVLVQLIRVITGKTNPTGVAKTMASYLPVYGIWAAAVTFIFPLLFGFR